ncbi:MAG: PAS domain S-box protein [Deltaproteobacteria bacterium]|nr:PAS domain S-box protein [Deltaproteobacteria bacterium]
MLVSETKNPPFRKAPSLFRNAAHPLYNVEGNIIGAIEVIRDITERMRAENALRESEERFRRLPEYSPFGLSIMNRDETFEYFNIKFTEMFGYEAEDLPDKKTWFARRTSQQSILTD